MRETNDVLIFDEGSRMGEKCYFLRFHVGNVYSIFRTGTCNLRMNLFPLSVFFYNGKGSLQIKHE